MLTDTSLTDLSHHTAIRLKRILTEHLRPVIARPILIVCLGTDRSTGDSFGPFTGSLLHSLTSYPYIYGTLSHPIHRQNYFDKMTALHHRFPHGYIIAIDASLGKSDDIGHIRIREGSIRPAGAFSKELPPIGNLAVTGIVGASGIHDYQTLQSARLSLILSMASQLAETLSHALTTLHIQKDIG